MPLYRLTCVALLALTGCTHEVYSPENVEQKGVRIEFPSDFAPGAAVHCIERNAERINSHYVSTARELDNGLELTVHAGSKDGDAIAVAQILSRGDKDAGSAVTLTVTPRNASPRSLAMALRGKC